MNVHRPPTRLYMQRYALLCMLVLWCGVLHLSAQTDTISGVINRYTRVLAIDHCNTAIAVENPYGFSVGDRVMLIQMKGASVKTVDSASFGDVLSNGDAGNYELATIDIIDGQTVIFKYKLVRVYDFRGFVQMVRVPVYTNALVRGTLEPLPWNGKTGGVLAFIASDTVELEDETSVIDATAMGFRGGDTSTASTTYTFEHGYRYGASSTRGSHKGESIVVVDSTYMTGRGHLATGGGGGNARSSGGGGGGNYGNGGRGGNQYRQIGPDSIGGLRGLGRTYSNVENRVYLGGGGGGGHNGLSNATSGYSGGGIVFVRAEVFIGNGGSIDANGDGRSFNAVEQDGAGGGGAGGVLLLDIDTFLTGSPSTSGREFGFFAVGGTGQSTKKQIGSTGTDECYGPGGGGGGGVIWAKDTSAISISTNRPLSVNAGPAGEVVTGSSGCQGTTYGAQAGTVGTILTGLQVPEGTDPR